MNIIKPQNRNIEKLDIGDFSILKDDEKLSYIHFENNRYDNTRFCEIEFEYCRFVNIRLQSGKAERITFKDTIFDRCNFSKQIA